MISSVASDTASSGTTGTSAHGPASGTASTTTSLRKRTRHSEENSGVEKGECASSRTTRGSATDRKRVRLEEEIEVVATTFTADADRAGSASDTSIATQAQLKLVSGPERRLPRKRAKIDEPSSTGSVDATESAPTPKLSPLLNIPAEIFAEILNKTSSPKDILSLSLTCKAFRQTLLLPSSAFIWKHARMHLTDHYSAQIWIPGNSRVQLMSSRYELPDFEAEEYGGGVFFGGSEAKYAAFAYGWYRSCETCGAITARPFVSFALRISLCKKRECKNSFMASHLATMKSLQEADPEMYDQKYLGLYPCLEDNLLPGFDLIRDRTVHSRMSQRNVYRSSNPKTEHFIRENKGNKDFNEMLEKEVDKNSKWMKLCNALEEWRTTTSGYYHQNKRANDERASALAKEHGWNKEDMLNCTVFGPYYHNKCRVLESLSDVDIAVLLPTMTSQLEKLITSRGRRVDDKVYHIIQREITSYHKYLVKRMANPHVKAAQQKQQAAQARTSAEGRKKAKDMQEEKDVYDVLPCLSAFKELPIMQMLQGTHLTTSEVKSSTATNSMGPGWKATVSELVRRNNVAEGLRNNIILSSMVKDQVCQWVEKAKEDLGKILNVGVDAAMGAVAQVEDITSRWKCQRCDYLDPEYAEDGCFDFRGACGHECFGGARVVKGKKVRKMKWNAANFVRDDQAIAALQKVRTTLEVQGRNRADHLMFQVFAHGGGRKAYMDTKAVVLNWRCSSCNPPVRLTMKSIVGHSHRHEGVMDLDCPLYQHQRWGVEGTNRHTHEQYDKYCVPEFGSTYDLLHLKPKPKGKMKAKSQSESGPSSKANVAQSQADVPNPEGESGGSGTAEKKEVDQKKFGCRHCFTQILLRADAKQAADAATAAAAAGEAEGEGTDAAQEDDMDSSSSATVAYAVTIAPVPIMTNKVCMTFNGMRSHLKAKHGVPAIRDEDYFIDQPDWNRMTSFLASLAFN